MRFTPLKIFGAFLIDLHCIEDERGYFSRNFCEKECEQAGLSFHPVQMNTSYSKKIGTLRGLHYQTPPFEEKKLVKCLSGGFFDVFVDLRPSSPTYKEWMGVELYHGDQKMLLVPNGCAHGFQTLQENTEILYLVSAPYSKENERGVRWNDPTFSIAWPKAPSEISLRDQHHPDFEA